MRADAPDPQVQALLDRMERADLPAISDLSVAGARRLFETFGSSNRYRGGEVTTTDREVETPDGLVPIRIYRPTNDEGTTAPDTERPTTVYFHGGGFVVGSLETHDALCRAIADTWEMVVVAVHYRRAPEHPFPAAVHDGYAVTEWARANADDLGGSDEVVVAGDSAGGTLAAVVSLLARDRDEPTIDHQVLFYPAISADDDWPSVADPETGLLFSAADMAWFGEQYLADPLHAANPYAFPLEACSHADLPPATVVTAGFDPLRDEGRAYAEALAASGVPVTHRNYDDMIHGFVSMVGRVDGAKTAIAAVGDDLENQLG